MNIKGIVVHCSDSPHGRRDNASTIHKWHKERGFDGIGYHYVITEQGFVETGRPPYWDGAHCKGYNDTHLGICLIGIDYFTEAQFLALESLVKGLMDQYNINPKNVIGHYMADENKTCPNFNVQEFMATRNL